MNHKRGRSKNQRAGCLLCKPHKANGVNVDRASVERQVQEPIELLHESYLLDQHVWHLDDSDDDCFCWYGSGKGLEHGCEYCKAHAEFRSPPTPASHMNFEAAADRFASNPTNRAVLEGLAKDTPQ